VAVTGNGEDKHHGKRRKPGPDIKGAEIGTDDREFKLRAEKQKNGEPRKYTMTYRATDFSGNTTEMTDEVAVGKKKPRQCEP
jgi:hypothetical protein